jgi:integrase
MRGHIRRRGRKWVVVVDIGRDENGKRKQRWYSGFDRRSEAEEKLTEVLGQLRTGTHVEPTRMTLAEFLHEEWLPARKANLRPSTYESYRRNIRVHIERRDIGAEPLEGVAPIGGVRLQHVTPARLNQFYGELLTKGRRDGRGLSPRTVRYIHTILRRALQDAVKWGKLIRNPADAADPPTYSAARPASANCWTAEQLRAFLEHVRDERLYPMWLLFATTGMRRGEVAGLTWDDVDLDAARIAVRRARVTVGHDVDDAAPKSDRGRRNVALDRATAAALRTWRSRQLEEKLALGEANTPGALVFTWEDGHALHPDWISKAFKRRAQAARLPALSVHGLRHTSASLALQAGVHPKVVSERIGHSTVSLTLDTYSHAIPALQESAAELVAQLVVGEPAPG